MELGKSCQKGWNFVLQWEVSDTIRTIRTKVNRTVWDLKESSSLAHAMRLKAFRGYPQGDSGLGVRTGSELEQLYVVKFLCHGATTHQRICGRGSCILLAWRWKFRNAESWGRLVLVRSFISQHERGWRYRAAETLSSHIYLSSTDFMHKTTWSVLRLKIFCLFWEVPHAACRCCPVIHVLWVWQDQCKSVN